MSNYPLPMNEEPTVGFTSLESPDMETQPDFWQDIPHDLQAELANLEQLERNEANVNPIERTLHDELLREEQAWSIADLTSADVPSEYAPSLPTRDALIERANNLGLYDARFMGKTDRDTEGNPVGQTLQAVEVYQDTNGVRSGKVLDVAY